MKRVVEIYLKTAFIGHTQLKSEIARTIDESGLCISKIILLCDGLNANKKLLRLINSEKGELTGSEGLLDIGTCKIHLIPNVFRKGMQEINEIFSKSDHQRVVLL